MPRPRGDVQPRILVAALEEFSRLGVDGASLRSIARAAKSNIGMIYYYYPSKDDLFFAVVEGPYQGMLEKLTRALDPAVSFDARVERLFGFLAALDAGEIAILRLVAREALASSERMHRFLERSLRGHLPLVFGLLQSGMREGRFDPELHPVLVLACLGGIGFFSQLATRFLAPRLLAMTQSTRGVSPSSVATLLPELGSIDLGSIDVAAELARVFLRAVGAPAAHK